jgi:hypothetical protein
MRSAYNPIFDRYRYSIGAPVDRPTLPLTVALGNSEQHVFVICSFSCLFFGHPNKTKWNFSYSHSTGDRIVFTMM